MLIMVRIRCGLLQGCEGASSEGPSSEAHNPLSNRLLIVKVHLHALTMPFACPLHALCTLPACPLCGPAHHIKVTSLMLPLMSPLTPSHVSHICQS